MIISQYHTGRSWNHLGRTTAWWMTSSWQNRALGRSRRLRLYRHRSQNSTTPIFTITARYPPAQYRHHPRQLFAAEEKSVYTDIARTPFKGTIFRTPVEIPVLFTVLSQPTALAMTIARTAASYTPRLCSTVDCQRVYAKSYVFASVVCTCTHEERGCTWMWRPWSSAATAPNFELASATNLEIYSTTTRPSLPMFVPPPRRKNYSPVREMCIRVACVRIYNVRSVQTCVHQYAWTCERTQTNTVTTPRSAGNTYPGAIFTQADRAVIPRAYPPSP